MSITVGEFEGLECGDVLFWLDYIRGDVFSVKKSEGKTHEIGVRWEGRDIDTRGTMNAISLNQILEYEWLRKNLSKGRGISHSFGYSSSEDSIWERNKKLLEGGCRWRAEAVETPECWKKNPFLFEEKPYKPEVSLGNRVERLEREIFSMYGVQFKEMKKDLGCLWILVLFLTLSALGSWFLTYQIVKDGIQEENAIYEAISVNYEDIKRLEKEAEEERE